MGYRSWLMGALLVLLLTAVGPPKLSADIINGTFSAGYSGFSTGYTDGGGKLTATGKYAITSDSTVNGTDSWTVFGDHTSGSGNMMVVNGSTSGTATVWQGSSDSILDPGTYTFSAWVTSPVTFDPATCTNCAATLQFSVVGDGLIGTFTAPSTAGSWQQFQGQFTLTTAGTPSFRIVDTNTGIGYNDFAIDDIHIAAAPIGVPDGGMTLILLGGALVGIEALRRKLRV